MGLNKSLLIVAYYNGYIPLEHLFGSNSMLLVALHGDILTKILITVHASGEAQYVFTPSVPQELLQITELESQDTFHGTSL